MCETERKYEPEDVVRLPEIEHEPKLLLIYESKAWVSYKGKTVKCKWYN